MTDTITLSELADQIQETVQQEFEGRAYWVKARIMNVKKYEKNRRCYLTLEDYENGTRTAELKSVFWANTYAEIEQFEKITKQVFKDGIEITCLVKLRFHKIYGLNLDVIKIDSAHTLGVLEMERQQTLDRLVKENPASIQLFDGVYRTYNNRLQLSAVIENIALITAPHSDGQRDFLQELLKNKHGYTFSVAEFLTTIQGETAHQLIIEQLQRIEKGAVAFDAVAIVRGGGSQADFKPFDNYDLAKYIAGFPVPVFTGIGHDRNQSIADLMAREQKTPTKVAALFVEHNFLFENQLMDLKTNLFNLVNDQVQDAREKLENARRIVKLSSPQTILARGFAIVTINNKIVTDPQKIKNGSAMKTLLRNEIICSTVTKKELDEKRTEL